MESESPNKPSTPSSAWHVSEQSEYLDIHVEVIIYNIAGKFLYFECKDATKVNDLILAAKDHFQVAGLMNRCLMALNTKILNPQENILKAILDQSDKLDGTILTFIVEKGSLVVHPQWLERRIGRKFV